MGSPVQRQEPTEADHEPVQLPQLLDRFPSPPSLLDLCTSIMPGTSRSELRRLIRAGGVRLNTRKAEDESARVDLAPETLLWIGKRRKFRLEG
jgi:tyrosyl-tRNA synthetase